jgi:hypothetical protein
LFVSDRLKRTKVSNVSYRLSRTIGLNCSAVSCHIGREKHDDVWKSENRGHRSIPSSCIASLSDAWCEWYRYYRPDPLSFHVARGPTIDLPSTWPDQYSCNISFSFHVARPGGKQLIPHPTYRRQPDQGQYLAKLSNI